MSSKELETVRLRLRPCGPKDLEPLHLLWTDPDVRRHLWDDTVIAREQAWEVIEGSDYVCDFGPGAGKLGGEIVAQGSTQRIAKRRSSIFAMALATASVISVRIHWLWSDRRTKA